MARHNTPLILKQHYQNELNQLEIENIEGLMRRLYENWIINEESLKMKSESEVKSYFIEDVFTFALGYSTMNTANSEWNITVERSAEADSKRADAILGKYSHDNSIDRTIAVVEIKGPLVDLDLPQKRSKQSYSTPVDQAMQYSYKYDGCKWVVLSNIYEIRLYKVGRSINYYEEFNLREIATDINEFKRFYYLLSKDNIIGDKTDEVSKETYRHLEEITSEFYVIYNNARYNMWNLLKESNQENEIVLLEKTQKILDRIIFICFAQVKGLLPPNELQKFINEGKQSSSLTIWHHVNSLFRYIDSGNKAHNINQFNGELFKPDSVLDYLYIPNDVFDDIEKIIDHNFSDVLNVNILGHIFEQSISDIENLKNDNTAKRKNDGIFYTPEHITQFMVENTLLHWFEDKRQQLGYDNLKDWRTVIEDLEPEDRHDVSKIKSNRTRRLNLQLTFWENYMKELHLIKIMDPACGSGAFLNKLFELLSHEKKLAESMIKNIESARILDDPTIPFNQFTLFNDIEKDTLNNNLFGVDLNKESVEITKLSLWLNTALPGKKLTNLNENIKRGNSLIDDLSIVGEKAFKWEQEFDSIIENGGFDIILGNPPYVTSRNNTFSEAEKKYFRDNYELQIDKPNTYLLFVERSLQLMRHGGYLGFILPNSWLGIDSATNIRKYLLEECTIKSIVNLYGISFPDASVETVILIIQKNKAPKKHNVLVQNLNARDLHGGIFGLKEIPQKKWFDNPNYIFDLISSEDDEKILTKLNTNSKPLIEVADPKSGLQAYELNKGTPKQTKEDRENRVYHFNYKLDDNTFRYLEGSDVKRYSHTWSKEWLKYGRNLSQPRSFNVFSEERILVREVTGSYPALLKSTYMTEIFLNNKSVLNVLKKENGYKLKYVLAVLNSKFISFYFKRKAVKSNRTLFPKITLNDLKRMPIPKADGHVQEEISDLVTEILSVENEIRQYKENFLDFLVLECDLTLNSKLKEFQKLSDKEFIQEIIKVNKKFSLISDTNNILEEFRNIRIQIQSLSHKSNQLQKIIDLRIYELSKLTPDEIEVVENYLG